MTDRKIEKTLTKGISYLQDILDNPDREISTLLCEAKYKGSDSVDLMTDMINPFYNPETK